MQLNILPPYIDDRRPRQTKVPTGDDAGPDSGTKERNCNKYERSVRYRVKGSSINIKIVGREHWDIFILTLAVGLFRLLMATINRWMVRRLS